MHVDAAGRRGPRAGVVVVGGPHAHERHGDVGVVVDEARAAGGSPVASMTVAPSGASTGPHRGDLLAVDEDVRVVLAVGRDHAAALDQRVVCHVVRLPCRTSWASVSTSPSLAASSSITRRVADERRRDVQDRVAAVVGPCDEPRLEQPAGQEAAQHALALVGVQARVSSSFTSSTAQKKPGAADVADDRQRRAARPGAPRRCGSCARTFSRIPSRWKTSRLRSAIAAQSGCPANVMPCMSVRFSSS